MEPTTSSPLSSSKAFGRLHPKAQRWIYRQRWNGLRDIQEQAVEPILEGATDVIIAAATASGKTEAAFLPICSRLAEATAKGVQALYVAPLKALINDQFERLEGFCADLEIPVHRWHGDVANSRKKRVVESPDGILLITPESLEGLFVLRATRLSSIFGALAYVVVDELHSFIGTERGRQLQSLLHRLELVLRRRVPRVGLSATLGDMDLAADFIRPGGAGEVQEIVSAGGGQEIQLQVRGYRVREFTGNAGGKSQTDERRDTADEWATGDDHEIADHLFRNLRGTDNLVFANRRETVELYADLLRRLSERERVPNEFLPHHGSLAKELREDVEARLKEKAMPETIICTTTLEMGIDIGHIEAVAQIGTPPCVAALTQRLGRSGRRGEPARLRLYIQEEEIAERTAPQESLREALVQTIAMVELLRERWCEPPVPGALHLSTLVHQVMSLVAQRGGVRATDAWSVLCGSGPFSNVGKAEFAQLLRCMGRHDLVTQEGDGTLLLGVAGERIVNHYTFYAVFATPEEYRLVAEGRNLGTLPNQTGLEAGEFVTFAGRRWAITAVDHGRKIVDVVPAPAGKRPLFEGQGWIHVHDRVRERMFAIYTSGEMPVYLDERAHDLLSEGRENFRRYGLDRQFVIPYGRDSILFPWMGDRVMQAALGLLLSRGLKANREGVALVVENTPPEALLQHLKTALVDGPPDPLRLISLVRGSPVCKYDWTIDEDLRDKDQAGRCLDALGAWKTLSRIVVHDSETPRVPKTELS